MNLDQPRLALTARRQDSVAGIILVTLLALLAIYFVRAPLLRLAEKDASATGRPIHATIVDETTGEPVAGARVSTVNSIRRGFWSTEISDESTTNRRGEVTLRSLKRDESDDGIGGSTVQVLVEAKGYLTSVREADLDHPSTIILPRDTQLLR